MKNPFFSAHSKQSPVFLLSWYMSQMAAEIGHFFLLSLGMLMSTEISVRILVRGYVCKLHRWPAPCVLSHERRWQSPTVSCRRSFSLSITCHTWASSSVLCCIAPAVSDQFCYSFEAGAQRFYQTSSHALLLLLYLLFSQSPFPSQILWNSIYHYHHSAQPKTFDMYHVYSVSALTLSVSVSLSRAPYQEMYSPEEVLTIVFPSAVCKYIVMIILTNRFNCTKTTHICPRFLPSTVSAPRSATRQSRTYAWRLRKTVHSQTCFPPGKHIR